MAKNILLILIDQLQASILGTYGGTFVPTPNIDLVAGEGCVFERMYCQSPVCGPARASLLTGRHVFQHRATNNSHLLPDQEFSYARALRENGYTAAAIGRTHNFANGYQVVPVPIGDSFEYNLDNNPIFGISNYFERGKTEHVNRAYDLRVAETTCMFLEDTARMQPFVMFTGFLAPHAPFALSEPYASMFDPNDVPLPVQPETIDIPPILKKRYAKYAWLTEEDSRKGIAFYCGMVAMVDDCIGKIVEKLKALGLYDDTLLIITSDHGEMLGERGLYDKFVPYESSTNVPCIVRGGEFTGGKRISALTEHIDLTATILEYAGVEIPSRIAGKPLTGLALGETQHKDYIYSQITEWRMIRDERYKLVIYTDGYGELYDMDTDPLESKNLYYDETFLSVRSTMEKKMLMHYINTVDHSNDMFPECLQKRGAFNNGIGN